MKTSIEVRYQGVTVFSVAIRSPHEILDTDLLPVVETVVQDVIARSSSLKDYHIEVNLNANS